MVFAIAWVQDNLKGREAALRLAAVAILTLIAFALRVYNLDFQSFWRDEVDAVIFARESLPALVGKFTKVGENGPLYFTILHYWIALVGESEFALRFFSAASGVVAIPLTYAAGTRIVGRGTGMLAAAIAAVSPYYLWYSQEAKMYALLATLTLLSMYLFLRALEDNRPPLWVAFVVATSLSMYVHFFAVLVVVAATAVFLGGIRAYRERALGAGLSIAALVLPYLPLAVWELPLLANPPASPYDFVPFEAISTTLLFAFSVGFAGGGNVMAVTLFTFLLLCAALLGRREERDSPGALPGVKSPRWAIAVLVVYLLVPLLAFYVVSLRYPLFTERYLIIVLPAFQILTAVGLLAVWRRSIILFAACAVMVLYFSLTAISTLQQTPIKTNFRAAVQYYEASGGANDAVMTVMPYMRRSFEYYHRSSYRWIEPPYANQGAAEEMVARELKAATGGVRRLWVFVAEEDFWDGRGLIRGWLDKNAQLLDLKEFVGVELRYYELP